MRALIFANIRQESWRIQIRYVRKHSPLSVIPPLSPLSVIPPARAPSHYNELKERTVNEW